MPSDLAEELVVNPIGSGVVGDAGQADQLAPPTVQAGRTQVLLARARRCGALQVACPVFLEVGGRPELNGM